MFTPDGSKIKLDSNGLAAVTLDFAFLRCHTNNTVEWAASYANDIHTRGISTSVKENKNIPATFTLEQNYPNPFKPNTTINFTLPKSTNVKLDIYNVSGEYIATLVKDYMPAGYHSIQFVADGLPSGVYIYKLITDEISLSKKMVLMK